MDVVALAQRLEAKYRGYLKNLFYFKDPDFRKSFEDALTQGHLSRGPYLEATPVFRRGPSPRELLQELGVAADEGFVRTVDGDRPLYRHQEQAIRRVAEQQNVVVATGTASGKTEAFLFPILLHLYREFLLGDLCAGVRALVLYPMNALANDQRARLGEICQGLEVGTSPFRFTFGQYIGETPEDERDAVRHARDHAARRLPGEIVFRSEMRATPPHILLTNYSMLEYLLLRPDDSPLFDSGRARWWTFLVLDEAHQYRGSRGMEMAMLLRRLKQRLRDGGRKEPFQCIATSATLAGSHEDSPAVAKFASDLFGEAFVPDNVILSESEPLPARSGSRLTPADYEVLADVVDLGDEGDGRMEAVAVRLGITLPPGGSMATSLGRVLREDARAIHLARLVTARPAAISQLAEEVFGDVPENGRIPALQRLVGLLIRAEDPDLAVPLLSARYHFFLRSLEGALVAYRPEKKVFLDRRSEERGFAVFEVALCRECGQHYFVGRISDGRLVEAIRDPTDLGFGASFFRPLENAIDDGDDAAVAPKDIFYLCLDCAAIDRRQTSCRHGATLRVARGQPPADEDRADQLVRCGACGYSAAGRDPVREVVHGSDGPNAVIATTICQNLPDQRRKLLAFADGRQEAAFFAWYLEDSYGQILSRNLLLAATKRLAPHTSEGISLKELTTCLREVLLEAKVLPPATGQVELSRETWLRIYREFLTDEPRISLEGVGSVRWSIKWPPWFQIPDILMVPPWSLSAEEAQGLLIMLLDSMRTDRAVELRCERGVFVNWQDLGLAATQMRVRVGDRSGQRSVRLWDGAAGKRTRLLEKLLLKNGVREQEVSEYALQALRSIWETIRRCDEDAPSSDDRLLLSVDDARRLNPDWWRLHLVTDVEALFRCETCGRLQAVGVRTICPRHQCPGALRAVGRRDLESNHYRTLYEESLPGSLRVEEHTAQLDNEKAREFQQEFREGKIQVLSCSTTFELGVDLGDLDVVFLRNVPPEAFNYTQRVGRAGRRSRHPGFAVTYCRRGPHDLYHFADPQRMLSGRTKPPVLTLGNEKIVSRHIVATALSVFFRAFPERFKDVASLLGDFHKPTASEDIRAFLQAGRTHLERILRDIVPPDMASRLGLDGGSWIVNIAGKESRLARVEVETASDYKTVAGLEAAAAQRGDYETARWARARAQTISAENALSFLSRKVVIPKYGFPVDVVELDTHRTQRSKTSLEVSLQRDLALAISEFAPSNSLVANKKKWTSYALKRVAEREWPRKHYKKCAHDNVFFQWEPGQSEPPAPCGHQLPALQYILLSADLEGHIAPQRSARSPSGHALRALYARTRRETFSRRRSSDLSLRYSAAPSL